MKADGMTEKEARCLVEDVVRRGWFAEVDQLRGQPANRPMPFFVRVHAPVTVPVMQHWARFGRSVYSTAEYRRLFCPQATDYAEWVAEEALAELPSDTRKAWLTLADNSNLYFWRAYRGSHRTTMVLTGAVTFSIHPAWSHEHKNHHLEPGWTDERFTGAVRRALAKHMARPEWQQAVLA